MQPNTNRISTGKFQLAGRLRTNRHSNDSRLAAPPRRTSPLPELEAQAKSQTTMTPTSTHILCCTRSFDLCMSLCCTLVSRHALLAVCHNRARQRLHVCFVQRRRSSSHVRSLSFHEHAPYPYPHRQNHATDNRTNGVATRCRKNKRIGWHHGFVILRTATAAGPSFTPYG